MSQNDSINEKYNISDVLFLFIIGLGATAFVWTMLWTYVEIFYDVTTEEEVKIAIYEHYPKLEAEVQVEVLKQVTTLPRGFFRNESIAIVLIGSKPYLVRCEERNSGNVNCILYQEVILP